MRGEGGREEEVGKSRGGWEEMESVEEGRREKKARRRQEIGQGE